MKKFTGFCACWISLFGCVSKPDSVEPVKPFNLTQYMGKWYEIARLDNSFERGLSHVTANYSLNSDGTVQVVNRGWDNGTSEWKEAMGKAKFVETPNQAYLKVSFWGPFYSSYIVFYLSPNYSTALVSGFNKSYFWILSRHKTLTKPQLDKLLNIAEQAGFDTKSLIYPDQDNLQNTPAITPPEVSG